MDNNQLVTPKVALITGAGRRIGAKIAAILHENGINVALHCHQSVKEAEILCEQFNQARPHSAMLVQGDLTQFNNLCSIVTKAAETWGQLDVLVNNASCFFPTQAGSATENDWNRLVDTNLKAPFFLAQAAYPFLKTQKGCIINIVDIHAISPLSDYPIYSISKAGLAMLTKTLAKEWGPHIRVNSISPGAIMWPENENTLSEKIKNKIIEQTALKTHGDPLEIAKAVLFLVRDADFMTGQNINVDGGRTLFN